MSSKPITPAEQYPELAKALGVSDLYLKREDMHPYGSHKGRSIPVMIDHYYGLGDRRFAISSSGNAALAGALHVQYINSKNSDTDIADLIDLDIFVGNNVAPHKLSKLQALADDHIRILTKERPLQALTAAVQDGMRSLRQSTDDIALIGYKSLAEELAQIKDIGSIFIGTSSGTTAQALAQYFSVANKDVQIHIVQTSSCHRLAESFDPYDRPDEQSIADAIVDQTAMRKSAVIPEIKKTGGHGWFAVNESILTAQELTQKHAELLISTNSALSIAGVMQAVYASFELKGAVVCLICGD